MSGDGRSPKPATTRPPRGEGGDESACGALVWGSAAFRGFSRGGPRLFCFSGDLWLLAFWLLIPPQKEGYMYLEMARTLRRSG
eukprot:3236577-Prymnesium_polylepis.1